MLAACGTPTDIRGDVDPQYAPAMADPIFLALPDNPSVRDKKALPFLHDEMARSGFTVVDAIDRAKWVVTGSTDSQSFQSGYSFHPFSWHADTTYAHSATFYIVVCPADQYAKGVRTSAWAGSITAEEAEYMSAPNAMVHALLGIYGKNYEERSFRVKGKY